MKWMPRTSDQLDVVIQQKNILERSVQCCWRYHWKKYSHHHPDSGWPSQSRYFIYHGGIILCKDPNILGLFFSNFLSICTPPKQSRWCACLQYASFTDASICAQSCRHLYFACLIVFLLQKSIQNLSQPALLWNQKQRHRRACDWLSFSLFSNTFHSLVTDDFFRFHLFRWH